MPHRSFPSSTALALALAALLGVLLVSAPSGIAQSLPVQPPSNSGGISVVGAGIVLAQPNVAHISLGSDVFDPSLANAQAMAAQHMDAVISKLKADGIADTDIQTTSYNINPQYDQSNNQPNPVLRGYQVQNIVEVRTANVSTLGQLIDDAVAAGATRINGISFESDNMAALKLQARDQAMQDAQAKAQQLAKDAGVSLGRPVSITDSDTSGVTPVRAQAPQAAAPAALVTTPIQPGQLQVSANVTVVWSIQ